MGQIGAKWDKSGTFSDQISVHFGADAPKCTEICSKKSRICSIWGQSDPFWVQIWSLRWELSEMCVFPVTSIVMTELSWLAHDMFSLTCAERISCDIMSRNHACLAGSKSRKSLNLQLAASTSSRQTNPLNT